jgi:hypothetical protein
MDIVKERWSNVKEKCFLHFSIYTEKWKAHEETWISFPFHAKHYFQAELENFKEISLISKEKWTPHFSTNNDKWKVNEGMWISFPFVIFHE